MGTTRLVRGNRNSLHEPRIEVGIPISVFTAEHSELLQAYKVGIIARIVGIYRVSNLNIYLDEPSSWVKERMVRKLFLYLLVAPYLRKKVFRRNDRDLRFAGALPPLNLETHGVGGAYGVRQALLVARKRGKLVVDAGLETPVEVEIGKPLQELAPINAEGKTIIHISLEEREGSIEAREPNHLPYTGYRITSHDSLTTLIRRKKRTCLTIGTSRYGIPISHLAARLRREIKTAECILVVFGGPRKGLREISSGEGLDIDSKVDYMVQTIENQGLTVVRTEEALLATLSLLSFLSRAREH